MRRGIWFGALLAWLTSSTPADAFLVAGKQEVVLEQAHYLAVREGTRTVLYARAIASDAAKGAFALIIPVPKEAAGYEADAQEMKLLEQLGAITGPRLVEYWEQDPCEFHTGGPDDGVPEVAVMVDGQPKPAPPVGEPPAELTYAAGAELMALLEKDGFALPAGAEAQLGGVERFVVVRAKPGQKSAALRLVLEGEKLVVPTRLLSLHAQSGALKLVVDVIAPGLRFEAANRDNLAAPSNIEVKHAVKGSTLAFHQQLVDQLFTQKPQAVITEYAWRATSCSPCLAQPLSPGDLSALGLGATAAGENEVMIFTEGNVAAKPDGPPSLRTALMSCYATALGKHPGLSGEVDLTVAIGDGGKVTSASADANIPPHAALLACAEEATKATTFDGSGKNGHVRVQFSALSRQYVSSVEMTRLRALVGKEPGDDLELRAGSAIAGGSEIGPKGAPEVGVYASPKGNHFQSRYTVRHKWKGKPQCLAPQFGAWGKPPKGVQPTSPPRAKVLPKAEQLVEGAVPSADGLAMRFPPPAPQPPRPKPGPGPAPAPSAAASAAPPPDETGPAAAVPEEKPRWIGYLALSVCALALWQGMRKREEA